MSYRKVQDTLKFHKSSHLTKELTQPVIFLVPLSLSKCDAQANLHWNLSANFLVMIVTTPFHLLPDMQWEMEVLTNDRLSWEEHSIVNSEWEILSRKFSQHTIMEKQVSKSQVWHRRSTSIPRTMISANLFKTSTENTPTKRTLWKSIMSPCLKSREWELTDEQWLSLFSLFVMTVVTFTAISIWPFNQ